MAYQEVVDKITLVDQRLNDIDQDVDEQELEDQLQGIDDDLYHFIQERVDLINEEEREEIMGLISDFPDIEGYDLFKIFYAPIADLFAENPYEGENNEGDWENEQQVNEDPEAPPAANPNGNPSANGNPNGNPTGNNGNEEWSPPNWKGGKKNKRKTRKLKAKKTRKTRKSKAKKTRKSRKGSKRSKSLKRK